MDTPTSNRRPPTSGSPRLGLPMTWVVGLALLGLPRVALHDLGAIQEGTAVNAVLVVVPPLAWILVALVRRVPNPFLTLLGVGVCYGLVLAVTHQLLWDVALDDAPRLGGNLSQLAPAVQELIMRVFAATSSVFTGVVVGALAGVVAWVLGAAAGRRA